MMAIRLLELRRVLKPTGSLYLHCDDTADAYLRLLCDAVFGRTSFKNAVIWKRSTRSYGRRFGRTHDTLLAYGNEQATWNDVHVPYSAEYLARFYRDNDSRGQYKRVDLTGAGATSGESGRPWRGHDPTESGRHWSAPRTGAYAGWIETNLIQGYAAIKGVHARLDSLEKHDLIHWPKRGSGWPMLKRYAHATEGQRVNDVFDDIRPVSNLGKEQVGYPTQKPLALLNRIINCYEGAAEEIPSHQTQGPSSGQGSLRCILSDRRRGRPVLRRERALPARRPDRGPPLGATARHSWQAPQARARQLRPRLSRRCPRRGARQPQAGAVRRRSAGREAPRPGLAYVQRGRRQGVGTETRRVAEFQACRGLAIESSVACVPVHRREVDLRDHLV